MTKGAGKSHFAKALERAQASTYVRINQDELKTRKKCEKICRETLQSGKTPIIDRCNFNTEQRSHFLNIAKDFGINHVNCVIFDYPRDTLIERCQKRVGHETVTSAKARKVVNLILGRIRHPDSKEGKSFQDVTFVRSTEESDEVVENILNERSISARSSVRVHENVATKKKRSSSSLSSSLKTIKKQRTDDLAGDTSSSPTTTMKKATPGADGFFKIYCDLDGVLADFDTGVMNIFNGCHPDNLGSIQLWSGINKADKFYENLPVTSDGKELWDALVAAFASQDSGSTTRSSTRAKKQQPLPDILTGVPRTKRFREEKFNWCVSKLGESLGDAIQCNHVDMAGSKKSHSIVKGVKKYDCVNIITCWSDNKHVESRPGA